MTRPLNLPTPSQQNDLPRPQATVNVSLPMVHSGPLLLGMCSSSLRNIYILWVVSGAYILRYICQCHGVFGHHL